MLIYRVLLIVTVYINKLLAMNSISMSGMLNGQWNVKPRWPSMEGNFVRHFQSPARACMSVLVSHATFYIFGRVFFENTHKTCFQKTEMSLRISNIVWHSQVSYRYIFSRKWINKLTRNLIKRSRKITLANYQVHVLFLPSIYHL